MHTTNIDYAAIHGLCKERGSMSATMPEDHTAVAIYLIMSSTLR